MSIKQKTIILLGVICMAVANYSRAGNGYNLLPQYVIYEKAENTFTIVENKKLQTYMLTRRTGKV